MNCLADRLSLFQDRLLEAQRRDLYFYHKPLEEVRNCWAKLNGRPVLLLSSYSYLGLQQDARIREAASEAWSIFGTGSHGSPLLAGTTTMHLQLQEELANFISCDDVMLFSSGYVANVATISTICGPGDYVFSDKLNHASIVDGCASSGARVQRFKHNDTVHLERLLSETPPGKTKLVVIDAVFSMYGDIADLPKVSALCRRYGAYLMVDEAHSFGVLGDRGSGIEEHFGMEGSVDIKMGVLSKSIPCTGAYVGGRKDLIDYLKHHARGYIFSGSLLPMVVASARASLKILTEEPWRVSRLRSISRSLRERLDAQGVICGRGETPIIPVITGDEDTTQDIVRQIQNEGVLVYGVLPPAVPAGTCRLRICANAAMTESDIDFAAKAVATHVRKRVGEVA